MRHSLRETARRWALALVACVLGLSIGCGNDESSTTSSSAATTTSTASPSSTSTPTPQLSQLAIWPAPDVVFDTPQQVAVDFVSTVLAVPPELGTFRPGDSRSGEIDVLSLGESGASDPIVRSTLILRQLGTGNGWFVLAASSEHQSIGSPVAGSVVAANALEISGAGRGFEGTVVVTARLVGGDGGPLDQAIAQGGSLGDVAPFTVSLDLSAASDGATVMILVRGGTGLETDPGEVAAIPVVVG